MPVQTRCTACQKYEERNENFCRVCGLDYHPDEPPFDRVTTAYTSAEKYCGNCGCTRGNCDCAHKVGT